ncbi:MAG: endonuclease/exonuclease/phosphatase family protein, partial [Acidiferrobacterales bacterium]
LQRFDFYRYGRLTTERVLTLLGVDEPEENLRLRRSLFASLSDDSRQMTAQAIRDTEADIVCLQEIDNREVLDDFHEYYVKRSAGVNYGWRRLIEGNDRRGIDVAVISKQRISVTSHRELTFDDFELFNQALDEYGLSPTDRIFRRDCLEVETKVDGTPLTIFVCHFKSMNGGRDKTMPVRHAEAAAVKRIIEDKFGPHADQADWLVMGDMNDYIEENGQPVANGLEPLLQGGFSQNLINNLQPQDRWTHFYTGGRTFHQLDYILASPGVAAKNAGVQPHIVRNGQPYRVPGIEDVLRFPRVGFDRPKASDHCPVAVTLTI